MCSESGPALRFWKSQARFENGASKVLLYKLVVLNKKQVNIVTRWLAAVSFDCGTLRSWVDAVPLPF